MKINFLALNSNLGHQDLAVKLMTSKNWITETEFKELERCLAKLEDFNNKMISENNGIEVIDTEAIDTRTLNDCQKGLHDWNHERWTDRRTQIYKCSICGKRREEV